MERTALFTHFVILPTLRDSLNPLSRAQAERWTLNWRGSTVVRAYVRSAAFWCRGPGNIW